MLSLCSDFAFCLPCYDSDHTSRIPHLHSSLCFCCYCCHSVAQSCPTLHDPVDCSNFLSFLKLMSIGLVVPSNHLVLCCPLFLLPSIFPSITVFSNKLTLLIRWPKYWSFKASTSVLPMNIHDWFPLGLTGSISLQIKLLVSISMFQYLPKIGGCLSNFVHTIFNIVL